MYLTKRPGSYLMRGANATVCLVPTRLLLHVFETYALAIGPLVSISMMGQPMVIVNTYKAAVDLFDKRGAIYSHRPELPSATFIGYTNVLPLMQYGERWREHRRLFSTIMGTRALVERFAPLQQASTHKFLLRLLKDPDNFVEHIKK